MGKGDTYRPVNKKKYDENYERIFGGSKNGTQNNEDNGQRQETILPCPKAGKTQTTQRSN